MPFHKFNIRSLSPSSLNAWRDAPGLWALRYLAGYREKSNAAVWRGNAIESGLAHFLRLKDENAAVQTAIGDFEKNALGLADDETEAERARIAPALKQAIAACKDETRSLNAAQLKIELRVSGLEVPVIGYADFVYDDGLVRDLKTTKALPSEPRPEHSRQVAMYVAGRRDDFKQATGDLLYVTDKKHAIYPVENIEELVREIEEDALSLQRFLSKIKTARDAIDMLPMPKDSFKWKPETTAFLSKMRAA